MTSLLVRGAGGARGHVRLSIHGGRAGSTPARPPVRRARRSAASVRPGARLVAMLALAVALVGAIPAPSRAAVGDSWNLAADFAASTADASAPSNPFDDATGAPVWRLIASNPNGSDELLTNFTDDPCGIAGTIAWERSGASAVINASGSDRLCAPTGNWVAGHPLLHPSSTGIAAAVGWQNPIPGTTQVTISGSLIDRDTGCGGGVSWSVEKNGTVLQDGAAAAIAGTFGNGGSATFATGASVGENDLISVTVGPNGDFSCDLTQVDVTISDGEHTWDVATDMLASAVAAGDNPWGDAFGRDGVWAFKQSLTEDLDDATLLPASSYVAPFCGKSTLRGFADKASIAVNLGSTSETCVSGQTYPAGAVVVDPSTTSRLAIVTWTSPITGRVDVNASVTDRDGGGGDGVTWYVQLNTWQTPVYGGVFGAGDRDEAPQDTFVPVTVGDVLSFVVDGRSDGSWDLTELDVTIVQIEPDSGGGGGDGDTTDPDVTVTFTPDGSNGWFTTSPATGTVTATDDVGVADITCTNASVGTKTGLGTTAASASITVSAQGTTSVTCTATDDATNSGSASVDVQLDSVAPTVALNPSANGCDVPGLAGWCRGTQTAGFSASDATSGVVGGTAFTRTTTTNGADVSIASGAVCDQAGNCAAGISATGFKIDSVAPVLALDAVQHTNEGFVEAITYTTVPATVPVPNVGMSGSMTDATSGGAGVTVNGVAALYNTIIWARVSVALVEGLNTFSVVGTDQAGNTATLPDFAVTFDPDFDDDGVANPIDPAMTSPGTNFSDVPKGGATPGIATVPAGRTISVTDAASSADGVSVTVAGSGDPVVIQLDGKMSAISLATGTYTVTDPVATTRVSAVSGGPATIVFTIAGQQHTLVVQAGGTAQLTETIDNGVLTGATIEVLAGQVQVDGTAVAPGAGTSFGARLEGTLRAAGPAFRLDARFVPPQGGSANPATEVTELAIGSIEVRVQPAQWVRADNAYIRTVRLNGSLLTIVLRSVREAWDVDVVGVGGPGLRSPVRVQVAIGDDLASTVMDVRR